MSELLFTLTGRCSHQQEIRKSRFLALAAPVENTTEAMAFLQESSDPLATHNCWAWRVGQDYRFNDDGEPGGTAGRPILQAIEGQGMDRVVVLVIRWYGGTKLGAGGLVRAYGGTAAECLRLAERSPLVAMSRLTMTCGFAELTLMKARLAELEAVVESESFGGEGVTLGLRLPSDRLDAAQTRISDLSRGRSVVKVLD